MKLTLKRIALKKDYTIGKLYIDNKYFCDTLEDKVLDTNRNGRFDEGIKIPHETAIPYGTYKILVNRSPRFNRELPRLLDVPYFSGILIHSGNNKNHTSGCILVGENKKVGQVLNSKTYETKLTSILKQAQDKKEPITIQII